MIATTFRQDKTIRETVNLHGDKQYMVAVEEMAELMQAISKYLRINYSGCDVSQTQKEAINNIYRRNGRCICNVGAVTAYAQYYKRRYSRSY